MNYCRNCGEMLSAPNTECPRCHVANGAGHNYCQSCGAATLPTATVCSRCGVLLTPDPAQAAYAAAPGAANTAPKSRLAAGLLGIFLGGLGIHSFYLGNTTKGVIQILVSLLTCGLGSLWGFIEGILIVANVINTDAYGNPLGQ